MLDGWMPNVEILIARNKQNLSMFGMPEKKLIDFLIIKNVIFVATCLSPSDGVVRLLTCHSKKQFSFSIKIQICLFISKHDIKSKSCIIESTQNLRTIIKLTFVDKDVSDQTHKTNINHSNLSAGWWHSSSDIFVANVIHCSQMARSNHKPFRSKFTQFITPPGHSQCNGDGTIPESRIHRSGTSLHLTNLNLCVEFSKHFSSADIEWEKLTEGFPSQSRGSTFQRLLHPRTSYRWSKRTTLYVTGRMNP